MILQQKTVHILSGSLLTVMLAACSDGGEASQTTDGGTTAGPTTGPTTSGMTSTTGSTDETTGGSQTGESQTSDSQTSDDTTTTASITDDPTDDPFMIEPDAGVLPCDLFDDTCPEGLKCMPYAGNGFSTWTHLGCFDIIGDAIHGEPCMAVDSPTSGLDTCSKGHMCWDVDDSLMGECVAFCVGSVDTPSCDVPMAECILTGDGPLSLCLPYCDLLAQDCGSGQACYPVNDTTVCAPVAVPDDQGNLLDECTLINECQAGLMCAPGQLVPDCSGDGCCVPFCDLSDPVCDQPGTECTAVFGEPDPWEENYGVCVIPE